MNTKPEEVFTPRSAEVNPTMYVRRPELENALTNALRWHMHMIIHWESWTGKSWLYKKLFMEKWIPFSVANLANASRLWGISKEFQNLVDGQEKVKKMSYEEEKAAEINAVMAKGALKHKDSYSIGQKEPFEACLENLRSQHKSDGPVVLVFDNLESIFSKPELLRELADIIILCDDERYAAYKVKILIVWVPGGIKEYFYKTPNATTVANRLTELPEVHRLTNQECYELIKKWFIDLLGYKVDDFDKMAEHIAWITDKMPQAIHEYCLKLAILWEATRSVGETNMAEADKLWLGGSMSLAYSTIEWHMNERDTKAWRRNQTLYALSRCEGEQFKASDIWDTLRKEFPQSTEGTTINIAQMLSQLAAGEHPLIRRSPKGDAFTFADPSYRMALRAMLAKTKEERVEKKPMSR